MCTFRQISESIRKQSSLLKDDKKGEAIKIAVSLDSKEEASSERKIAMVEEVKSASPESTIATSPSTEAVLVQESTSHDVRTALHAIKGHAELLQTLPTKIDRTLEKSALLNEEAFKNKLIKRHKKLTDDSKLMPQNIDILKRLEGSLPRGAVPILENLKHGIERLKNIETKLQEIIAKEKTLTVENLADLRDLSGSLKAILDGIINEGNAFNRLIDNPRIPGSPVREKALSPTPASPEPCSPRRLNILVVDDIEVNRKMLKRALEREGYKIELATNGAEAVERFKTAHYDLIFMDIEMPIKNGYEATVEIRTLEKKCEEKSTKRSIPIIALTANLPSPENIDKAAQAKMSGFISKPFDFKKISKLIPSYVAESPSLISTEADSSLSQPLSPLALNSPRSDADASHPARAEVSLEPINMPPLAKPLAAKELAASMMPSLTILACASTASASATAFASGCAVDLHGSVSATTSIVLAN